MRVLVTGAGGFVCRSIINVLLELGDEVLAVDRAFDDDLRQRWQGRVEMVTADVSELGDLSYDAFIHGAALTASPEESGMSPIENLRANLDPALAMIEHAGQTRRGILISSSAVFYETEPGQPITEDTPPTPLMMYSVAKHTIETLVDGLRTLYDYNLTVIRLGSVYGPEERSRVTRPRVSHVGKMINDALNTHEIRLVAPDEKRGWTFAPDIGQAVHTLLQKPTLNHALYHVASGQVKTAREIATIIQQQLPDTQIVEVPAPDHAPVYRKGYLSNERLYAETGFDSWTPFADGIAQIIEGS